jgi:histone acetyltransferase (RNA polymerase elongator complex component)
MQMMTGLPGATAEDDLETARMIAGMQADDARIYPTLVIRGTALEALFRKGEYTPLQMDEAVGRSAGILKELENGGVNVIRVGLHPSDSFLRGDELVAGPFHVAFRELVMTEVWAGIFEPLRKKSDHGKLHIEVSPRQFNFAIGHAAKNRKALLEYYDTVVFFRNADLKGREYHVHYH